MLSADSQRSDAVCRSIEIVVFYRDAKNPRVEIGRFWCNFEQLRRGAQHAGNVYEASGERDAGRAGRNA